MSLPMSNNSDMPKDLKNCRDLFLNKRLIAHARMQVGKGEESWVLVFEDGNALRQDTGEPIGIDSLKEILAVSREKQVQRIEKAQGRISDLDYVKEQIIKIKGILK